jgi:hypothetical protein
MFKYYLNRGLDVVEILATTFNKRIWWLPDLICDEVVDVVKRHVANIEFYHVGEDLQWSANVGTGSEPRVFYVIDYFGSEYSSRLGREAPLNTITIRDSVWFPYPFSSIEHNQIWFNSLRKVIRGAKGSSLISPFRLTGLNEVPNVFYHPSLTWNDMNKRFENYHFCKEILSKYAIRNHNQEFPSVFPIRLKHRDKVLEGLDTPLPEIWTNKHDLPNELYKDLMFIPLDSRFDKEKLADLATKIMELNK